MKARIVKYAAAMALLLLAACTKEPLGPEPQPGHTIHYSATVSEGTSTRATVNEGYHYIFEDGDKLYVTDAAGKFYGVLTLTSGAGTTKATFLGDLICDDEFQPVDDTELSAVLVSANDAIHTITDDKVAAERTYPTNAFASDFADAVSKYGDFTASSTFGAHSFTLTQHSSFLIFNVEVSSADAVSATVVNGSETRTGNVTPVVLEGKQIARFVAAFPGGTTLSEASATVGTKNVPINSATLLANRYYTVYEPLIPFPGFTIKAKEDDTQITLTTSYQTKDANIVQYSLSKGLFWSNFTNKTGVITLQAGQTICLRGTRSQYNGKTLFSTNKKCYIGGDIMSLMCTNAEFDTYGKTVVSYGFRQVFKGLLIDIDPDNQLILSATTLDPNYGDKKQHYNQMFCNCTELTKAPALPATTLVQECYKEMFSGCTKLTEAPALPATTMVQGCYQKMFYGCSELTKAPTLPATTMVQDCYREMFQNCTQLSYIKCLATANIGGDNSTNNWVNNVRGTGTFVRHPDAEWNTPGFSKIPINWTVETATQ